MRQRTAGRSPEGPVDDPLEQAYDDGGRQSPRSPMPPMPKIPPRPLDWPPGEGLDLPTSD